LASAVQHWPSKSGYLKTFTCDHSSAAAHAFEAARALAREPVSLPASAPELALLLVAEQAWELALPVLEPVSVQQPVSVLASAQLHAEPALVQLHAAWAWERALPLQLDAPELDEHYSDAPRPDVPALGEQCSGALRQVD
jgi:hypothetical protein